MVGNSAAEGLDLNDPDREMDTPPRDTNLDGQDDFEDIDSTMGDMPASSTASLSSNITDYEHENGRRYHAYKAGMYFMPNDAEEQDLMDLVHHISLVVHDGELFLSPVKSPMAILDVGTGTGAWAIDVADAFPAAYVVGTDLSPIQPTWVPQNVCFEVSDCESDWTFQTDFDLIHMRNLSGAIVNWPRLISQAREHMKAGGYLELINLDVWAESKNNALPKDSGLAQWRNLIFEAAQKFGRQLRFGRHAREQMIAAGFVDVIEEVFPLPLSPWMQDKKQDDVGRLMRYLMKKELEGLSLALFTRVLGWHIEDLRSLLVKVRRDMANQDYQVYCNVYYVYGQKPS